MENSFKSIVGQSKSILILLPTKPYFDQVASALGLYLALRDQTEVSIHSPAQMTVEFNRLIGVNKISGEMGNKNLVIRFTDYKASDIERVSYDIENSQFRLTVIPKQKITPPTKDQIELSYSGVTSDTVIIIGGANETHFPALSSKDLSSANLVHIGTRDITMSSNKSYVSFSRPASSISEVVASLIKESGYKLDEDSATDLLMGIDEASSNLTDPAVTAETFEVIADLMKVGGKRTNPQSIPQRRDFPQGAIPGAGGFNRPRPNFPRPQAPQVQSNNYQGQGSFQPNQPKPAFPQHAQRNNSFQSQNDQTVNTYETPADEPVKTEEKTPDDWLQPKIYKGSSIN